MTDEEILVWAQEQLIGWQKQHNIYSADGATDKSKHYALGRIEQLISIIEMIKQTKQQ